MKYPYLHMRKETKPYVTPATQCDQLTQNEGLCVTGKYVGGQYGEMIWQLTNLSDKYRYVGLVRGATLCVDSPNTPSNENTSNTNNVGSNTANTTCKSTITIPNYLFGRAFGDVYYLLGMSQFATSPLDISLYTLAVYENTIGFVFALPPHTTLNVPEYGFKNLVSYTAYLVEVELSDKPSMYAVIYSPTEYLTYYDELGQYLGALPPAYIVNSITAYTKVYIGASFNERIVLRIPDQWFTEANKLGNAVERVLQLLRKMI